jgi:hypothetical protein
VAAGVGTGSGRCGNGRKAVAAAKVGVPLTPLSCLGGWLWMKYILSLFLKLTGFQTLTPSVVFSFTYNFLIP